MSQPLTEKQAQALQEIHKLMGEHFDAAILITLTEDPNNSHAENLQHIFTGSMTRCLGLCQMSTQFAFSKFRIGQGP